MKCFRHIVIFLSILGSGSKIQAQKFTKIAKEIRVKDTIPEMTFAIITEDSIAIKKVLGHHKITEIKDKRMKNFYYEQGSSKL